MANLIKIKRSTGNAAPSTLAEGELAVSFLSGKLFVGNTTAVIPIGGVHSPGTLTANQALVANATSGIDKVIVANLQPTFIYANGASGSNGQILVSNSTGGVYWGASGASALNDLTDVTISSASNNQILVYDAGSSQFENHSISGNSGQVNVAFSSQDIAVSLESNVVINTLLTVGNSSVNAVVNSTSVTTRDIAATNTVTVGSNLTVNTTSFFVGNSTVNSVVNSIAIAVGSNVTVNTSTIFVGNSTVNTTIQAGNIALQGTQLTLGSNVVLNTTGVSVGNSTVNAAVNSTSVTASNLVATNTITAGIVTVNTSGVSVGNSTVNSFFGSASIFIGSNASINTTSVSVGNSTANSIINSSSVSATSLLVGSNVTVNATSFFVGNNTVNAVVNSTSVTASNLAASNTITVGSDVTVNTSTIFVGNSTVNAVVNSSSLSIGNSLINATSVSVGNSSANSIINSTAVSANLLMIASNVTVNTSSFFVGNSTVNTVLNSTTLTTNTANVLFVTVGSNVTVNVSSFFVGNSTVNTRIQSANIALGSNVVLNDTSLSIGNSSVNTSINSTSITAINVFSQSVNTVSIYVSNTAEVQGSITARANVTVNGALVVANTAAFGNTTITGFITVGNSTVNSAINSTSVSATSLLVGSNVVVNTSTFFVGNSSVNAVLTATTLDVDGTVTATNGSFVDLSVTGNLTVTGTLTTIDTTNLVVKDPLIKLANNNTSTDLLDVGIYGVYGDGGTKFTAFFRDQSDGGTYKLLSGLTVEPGTTVDLTSAVAAPLDVGALDATSLSLSTDLAVEHGGTGAGTFTSKGVIYGNGTSAFQVTSAGTDGQVLQANSTGFPVFADLDGGSF